MTRRRFLYSVSGTAVAGATFRTPWSGAESGAAARMQVDKEREWITTTEAAPWVRGSFREQGWTADALDLTVQREPVGPSIEGFGACFNELGWTSLSKLEAADREAVLQELFEPGKGSNLNLCRMPIGANDFSRNWYSYDETAGDFALERFSIVNDQQTLIPYIKAARHLNPHLRLWASPWSPPSWMKSNGHYAEAEQTSGRPGNGLRPDQVGKEGIDLFILQDRYLRAYALYFGKFIEAYKQNGIPIGMVMPQNEFNSAQPFPSCTWTPAGLQRFLRFLGPAMDKAGVEVFFGTLERGNAELLNRVLEYRETARWIRGVGLQWAGKRALTSIHEQHPGLRLYGSEQECGDGQNTWTYAGYCWRLMKFYLDGGASAYMYWNIALEAGGVSRWGWPQNSLVTVEADTKQFRYNHEHYILKHVSRFVQKGARRVMCEGTCNDALAFGNPDGSYVVIVRNEAAETKPLDIRLGEEVICVTLAADSLNTLLVPGTGKRVSSS